MTMDHDDGIVIGKPLAWTIVVALITAGIYFGVTVGTMSVTSDHTSAQIAMIEPRVRLLENQNARQLATIERLSAEVQRLSAEVQNLAKLIREDRREP